MTDPPKPPVLSGWCSPPGTKHSYAHRICQKRLEEGTLPRGCECPDHGGHTLDEPPLFTEGGPADG